MTELYGLRCDMCDAITPLFADEQELWRHVWADGWHTVATLPWHHCSDCKQVTP